MVMNCLLPSDRNPGLNVNALLILLKIEGCVAVIALKINHSLINCIDIQSEQQGAFLVIIGICSPRRTNWTDQIIPWTPCCNLSFEIDQETDKTMLVPLNIPRLTFEYYIYFVA